MSRVLVCEQGRPPGLGATTRSGALLRQHHTSRADINLAVAGLRMFQNWADEVGGDCGYRRTGFAVVVGREHADHLAKNVAAVNEAGGTSNVLTDKELSTLHPALRVPPDAAVGYEPDGGYADPVLATGSLLDAAARRGVTVAEGIKVTGIRTMGSRVTGVATTLGIVEAGVVVLCGGAWTPALTEPLGLVLPVQARRIGIARAAAGFASGALPIGIDDMLHTYFRPVEDGSVYFGVPLDPDAEVGAEPVPVTGKEARAAAARLVLRIRALAVAPLIGTRVGVDAYTPDRRPAIGWAGAEGLYLCTGFSGGGVKVAPAVGKLAAGEIAGGDRMALLEPYRPQRFETGELIESEFPYGHM
jgi:glycine/D-amino acid oxidase-like deaminating enzyme